MVLADKCLKDSFFLLKLPLHMSCAGTCEGECVSPTSKPCAQDDLRTSVDMQAVFCSKKLVEADWVRV